MKNLFSDLYETIELRKKSNKKNSYTKKLFKEGEKKIAQKFGEESSELIIDFLKGSKKRTIEGNRFCNLDSSCTERGDT